MSTRCSLGEGTSGDGTRGGGSPEVRNRNWQAENNLHVSPGRGRPPTWRSRRVQRGRRDYIKYYYWYYRFTFPYLPPSFRHIPPRTVIIILIAVSLVSDSCRIPLARNVGGDFPKSISNEETAEEKKKRSFQRVLLVKSAVVNRSRTILFEKKPNVYAYFLNVFETNQTSRVFFLSPLLTQ